jgi:hypothetical protein
LARTRPRWIWRVSICLDRTRAGSAAVAVLEGAAGIGKTRLVNEPTVESLRA